MSELNETVVYTVSENNVTGVPVDNTLTIEGQAADAAAVGRALDGKMDADALHISVNGQEADNQGAILIDGSEIDVSGTDSRSIGAAIAEIDGRTGADIPVSAAAGADSIAEAVADLQEAVAGLGSTDATLTIEGAAADAKAAGDGIRTLTEGLTELQGAAVKSVDSLTPDAAGNVALVGIVRTINGIVPGTDGSVTINSVSLADNLSADNAQTSVGSYLTRATGGNASVQDGEATMIRIGGGCVHTGQVEESLTMRVAMVERPTEEEEGILATIDRDAFKAEYSESGTYTYVYGGSVWVPALDDTGITVEGTPLTGDTITVNYIVGDRGTITPARPIAFVSTGWNLYNPQAVGQLLPRYSDSYGYKISGTYTGVQYSPTENGEKQNIAVASGGLFNIPADGYVFISGGNSTDTCLIATWSDWTAGSGLAWAAYEEDTIDISEIMTSRFPYGLLAVGTVRDEINVNLQKAISRIGRVAYSDETVASLISAGRAYDADTDYIYFVKETEDEYDIVLVGEYAVSEHGVERFAAAAGSAPIRTESLYGVNLKSKLERDVVTISSQDLSEDQQASARANIGAVSAADVTEIISGSTDNRPMIIVREVQSEMLTIAASKMVDSGILEIPEEEGYTPVGIVGWDTIPGATTSRRQYVLMYGLRISDGQIVYSARNLTSGGAIKIYLAVSVLYLRA